jgi:hypothetical protein
MRGQRASPHVRQLGQDRCHAHVHLPPRDRCTLLPLQARSQIALHTSGISAPKQPIGRQLRCATISIRSVMGHGTILLSCTRELDIPPDSRREARAKAIKVPTLCVLVLALTVLSR